MEAVLLLPVLLLVPIGLLAGAAITHYVGAWLAVGLAAACGVTVVILLFVAQAQTEFDAIGTRIVAFALVAPAAVGLALGAWLVVRRRRR